MVASLPRKEMKKDVCSYREGQIFYHELSNVQLPDISYGRVLTTKEVKI